MRYLRKSEYRWFEECLHLQYSKLNKELSHVVLFSKQILLKVYLETLALQ
jgi:hypothetical protein